MAVADGLYETEYGLQAQEFIHKLVSVLGFGLYQKLACRNMSSIVQFQFPACRTHSGEVANVLPKN